MKESLKRRHSRIRKKVVGTSARPRVCVFRSLKNLQVQIVDDDSGKTLLTCSTLDKELKSKKVSGNIKGATILGEQVARKAQEKGIKEVVFDRGGYLYHGCVKAIAEAARKGGLVF